MSLYCSHDFFRKLNVTKLENCLRMLDWGRLEIRKLLSFEAERDKKDFCLIFKMSLYCSHDFWKIECYEIGKLFEDVGLGGIGDKLLNFEVERFKN